MKKNQMRSSLRWKVTLIIVLTISFLLSIMTIFSFRSSENIMNQILNQNAGSQVKIHAQYLSNWLHTKVTEMEIMSNTSEIRSGDEESIFRYFQQELGRQNGVYLSFSITDLEGKSYSSDFIYSNEMKNPDIQKALKGTPTISKPAPALENPNNLIVSFHVPIFNEENNVTGVLTGTSKINTVFKENTDFKMGKNDLVYLVDGSGNVIYHPDKKKILTHNLHESTDKEKELLKDIQEKREGNVESVFYSPIEKTDWHLILDVPKQEFLSSLYSLYKINSISIASAVLFIAVVVFFIIHSVFKRLESVVGLMNSISEGDLSASKIPIKKQDEIGYITQATNNMFDYLQMLFSRINKGVSQSSVEVSSSSYELSHSTEQTMKAAKEISIMIENVVKENETSNEIMTQNAQLVKEMVDGIHQITLSSSKVSDYSLSTSEKAKNGHESIQGAVTQMNVIQDAVTTATPIITELKNRSKEIENIVDVINELTEHINLLSLNASIESARAGEHGRGFKVVAEEIKKLANQTSESAEQIIALVGQTQKDVEKTEAMMKNIHQEVKKGADVTEEAGQTFQDIAESVKEVTTQILETTSVSEELLANSEQVLTSFAHMNEISDKHAMNFLSVSSAAEEQLSSMQNIADYSEQLSKMAQNLEQLIEQIKIEK